MFDPATTSEKEWLAQVSRYVREARSTGETVRVERLAPSLTPAEAARRLGMSRSTISRRIKAGEISTIKVGAHHRIPVKEYERFRDRLHGEMVALTSDEIEADLYG